MSRMFVVPGLGGPQVMKTWNVFVGCRFGCRYCNARKLAEGRLRNVPRYQGGFDSPHLVKEELGRKFSPRDFVFAAYMGDISFASPAEVQLILNCVWNQPDTRFLFCTKDPSVYTSWGLEYPPNLYLGATIETNFDYGLTLAPKPAWRHKAMKSLTHPHKFISIEPLMDFHLRTMLDWMKDIGPEIIEVGGDNYRNGLPEPAEHQRWKVRLLLEELKKISPVVVEKVGLERLTGGHL